jgi:hypothetical protein
MLSWLYQLFTPPSVVTSQPYQRGREWVYFFGNDLGFQFRGFENLEEATSNRNLLLSAINIAPEISTRQFVISTATAQSVTDIDSYRELLQFLSESRTHPSSQSE